MPLIEIPLGTHILRVDQALETAAKVLVVATTFGRMYLKGPPGEEGNGQLVREWIGTRLAQAFHLPTLSYGILENLPQAQLLLADGRALRQDAVFATLEEPGAAWEGGSEALDLVGNRSAFSRLVVFDTWVRNLDRHVPRVNGSHENKGNVFVSSDSRRGHRPQLLAMDHTHVFGSPAVIRNGAASPMVQDAVVYGLFDDFRPRLAARDLERAIHDLTGMRQPVLMDMIAPLIGRWGLTDAAADGIAGFLEARAQFVTTHGATLILRAVCQRG